MPESESDKLLAPGPLLALAGLLIASVSAMCGIGGGLFAVPVLHYLFRVPLKQSVATALCLVWAVAVSATITEAVHPDGALFWSIILVLVGSSLVGTQLGFLIARRLATRALKGVFCVALLVAGAKIMSISGGGVPATQGGFVPDPAALGYVAVVGLCAGIVVPLLGVGGGLVVVPALLLGLPQVGWYGARAVSLAMAVVSSSRALRLYHSVGLVHWATGRWFGVGAGLGAIVGVQLVHRSGAAEVGQVLLGAVLCVAAVRFGWDFVRPAKRDLAADEGDQS